jgi:biotin carboxylase
MNEKLIILGAGVMQGPAITIAKELGFYTVALDGSKEAPCISMADQFEHIDLKNKEEIETFARSLQSTCGRVGIMTAGTDFSASVAWVAERLGLPGIPYEAALNASDKGRMRECFKKAALPSPDFVTITKENIEEIQNPNSSSLRVSVSPCETLTKEIPFPLVIKPVDNMGSRGCRRIDSIEEFKEAAKTAIGFSRSGRAIVESFMDGPEFSVDAIVYKDEITICGLADRHIFFPPYFIEMGHTMPTVIEEDKQEAMLETFRAGVRALGIAGTHNIGAAKGDIKLTAKGPMIGEIAARLSGGYRSGWTSPYSSGAQPIKGAILAAMGRKPEGLVPVKKWTCAERAFISIPGTVKAIYGVNEAKKEPHVNDLFLRITEGSKVTFPENNVTKCGNIIASAPDRETATKAAETAAKAILIHLDSSDPITRDFLTPYSLLPTPCFPPNAFELPDDILDALSLLPDPIPHSPLPIPYSLFPFPAFTSSSLTDYMGRTVEENLQAVRRLTGFSLPFGSENADNVVGQSFWAAFIRGAYQGAVYYLENLGKNEKDKNRRN